MNSCPLIETMESPLLKYTVNEWYIYFKCKGLHVSGFFGTLHQNSRAGRSGFSVADVQIQSTPNIYHILGCSLPWFAFGKVSTF